jgi:hypothetical protein
MRLDAMGDGYHIGCLGGVGVGAGFIISFQRPSFNSKHGPFMS